jgi:hypothetical protein
MNNPIQQSLFPDLVPNTEVENRIEPVRAEKPIKVEKVQKISQGDCVELPTGERGIVMLVNPLGDCYVEVKGQPFVYMTSDLKKLPIAIISTEISLHQIYLERHAYAIALSQAKEANSSDVPELQKAWEVREKFLSMVEQQQRRIEGES